MRMKAVVWAVVLVVGLGWSAAVRGEAVRGDINSWSSASWMNTNRGYVGDTYWSVTQTSTTTRAGSRFKFDQSGDWANQWGTGPGYINATPNATVGQARKNVEGNSPDHLLFDESSGMKYTFRLAGLNHWYDRQYSIQATTNFPISITGVSDNSDGVGTDPVTVTATLSAAPSGERVYVRYTTNAFSSWSQIATAVVNSTTATIQIPGQPSGTTVKYYVLTSTMPTNVLKADYDLCTLRANNTASGTNYAYLVGDPLPVFGECWHNPAEAVQGTDPAVPMRNPANPAAGASVYVYAGNWQADSGGANMTNGIVYYRKGASGGWSSIGMSFNNEVRNFEDTGWVKNWIAGLPTDTYLEDDVLQYVFQIGYDNRDTTFMGTTDQTGTELYASLAAAQASPYAVTFGAAPAPVFGNCWHFPTNEEPAGVTMRNPADPTPGKDTYIYVGNYQGDADMTGGWVVYKEAGAGSWSSNNLTHDSTVGDNAYWKAAIPSNAVALGQTLEYYIRVDYDNGGADRTWLGTSTQEDNVKYETAGEAAASPFEATSTSDLGNAWHAPANAEPVGAYMRNPRHPFADQSVTIYNGNQFAGEGVIGDQSGGTVHYRLQGAGGWSSAAMSYDSAAGNNKYWRGAIPAGAFSENETVEYVLAVTYTDRDTTYLGRADDGVTSESFASLSAAQAKPFDFTYGDGDPGAEPGFVWHGGNAVKLAGDTVQIWVKVGYKDGDTTWADHAEVRYKVDVAGPMSRTKQGVRALPGIRAADPTLTETAAMVFSHEEQDGGEYGNAMWWVATITEPDLASSPDAVLKYQIAAWNSVANGGNDVVRLAEYRSDGPNDQVFEYRMQSEGANALTVNGVNADYTTTKFFIDEGLGETASIRAVYSPPSGATDVQIFSNVGRRDYWDADLDANGVPDSIRPPSGDLVTTATEGYYAAWNMTWDAGEGAYVWEADIGECGAYRLTARYKIDGNPSWRYYSETGSGIRDHAIVISPRKVLQQTIYELNTLSTKATAATENGRSTFADLIGTSEGNQGTFDEFGIEYLNKIQANCLWFQPIHTSSEYGLAPGGEPGSPYSAKDYFAVGKWFGRDTTTAGALAEFQDFVAACDVGKASHMSTTYVGTINIMLDGVFNHTSWDAVFGEMGERMGIVPEGQGASTSIGSLRPGWFANYSDYGAPATFYNGPAGGQHDIASAPDRGDFGKWLDTAELFFGHYAALVRHNPDNNGDYLNEEDWYDYDSMTEHTEELWDYMGAYVEFWLEKTGHDLVNRPGVTDENGIYLDDYGIDGLRCDFAQGLPPQFWEYAVNRARASKWNFMFMAESLDGGVVSYRSNRHFDILNESFVFQIVGAGSPGQIKDAIESRRSLYSGSAVLLNLTSHDEVMPYNDPWVTASRYAMVSSVMGLPMVFYGQEQGIVPCTADKSGKSPGDSVPGDRFNGFASFELNMGKWVPHFKEWNKLLIWDTPPSDDWSRPMAQWYGRLNWARLNSPALQSPNQYFLGRKHEGTYDNGKIFAVAKYEEPGAVAAGKDAVLAFSLFVNEGAGGHDGANDTYDLAPCWDLLGLENSADVFYNVRNLAASDATAWVWETPKSGAELHSDGLWVSFDSDQGGRDIYDDGAIVQYLKIEEVPAPGAEATSESPVPVPYAWLDVHYPGEHSAQDYEDLAMQVAANGVMTVWQAFVANLDPTEPDVVFLMDGVQSDGVAAITVPVQPDRVYRIQYLDGSLADMPQVWNAFLANGVWTNVEPYASEHVFFDNGSITNSGSAVQTQRSYRVWVGLPAD